MKKTIGIIGYGNMGSAIASRIRNKYDLFVFDKDAAKLKQAGGMSVTGSIRELIRAVEAVIIAVKPQDFEEVLCEIKKELKGQ